MGTATANALLTDSNTKILQNPRIRSTDAQKATLKIGSRIPIATGSFSPALGATTATSLAETQFQYIDVGVNIEMTPTIHYNHDVTMKLSIEVSSEASQRHHLRCAPSRSSRRREANRRSACARAKPAVLGGILNQQDLQSWTGIPGLEFDSDVEVSVWVEGPPHHE